MKFTSLVVVKGLKPFIPCIWDGESQDVGQKHLFLSSAIKLWIWFTPYKRGSRPINTGNADTGVDVTDKHDVFFQQVAAGLEAVSESWNFNAYGLFPVGDTEQVLNNYYVGGALHTYGLDIGYAITPEWDASIGYYYQHGDDLTADDESGVLATLTYEISDGLTLGVNLSYDGAFETRVSGNIEYRFGTSNASTAEKKKWQTPLIQALTESVKHRDIRVHDEYVGAIYKTPGKYQTGYRTYGTYVCKCEKDAFKTVFKFDRWKTVYADTKYWSNPAYSSGWPS